MNLTKKSQFTSLILTIIFGPLGLIYASPIWGIVLTIIAVLTFYYTVAIYLAICIISIAIGVGAVQNHNDSVKIFLENTKGSTNG